jgi:hypothetical protein
MTDDRRQMTEDRWQRTEAGEIEEGLLEHSASTKNNEI